MNKENQNLYQHMTQNLQPKIQKMQFLKMKTHIIPTITIIKFINHKNSQISWRTRKNIFLKQISQQIIMIINLKNKTIMKKNMCHIIISKINMNHNLASKLKVMSKLQQLKKLLYQVLKNR